jgi:hypothetical protein
MTVPERVERTGTAARPFCAFFSPPRAIWPHKEVKDYEGLPIHKKKQYLGGVSRMSALVCCELSRTKLIVARRFWLT